MQQFEPVHTFWQQVLVLAIWYVLTCVSHLHDFILVEFTRPKKTIIAAFCRLWHVILSNVLGAVLISRGAVSDLGMIWYRLTYQGCYFYRIFSQAKGLPAPACTLPTVAISPTIWNHYCPGIYLVYCGRFSHNLEFFPSFWHPSKSLPWGPGTLEEVVRNSFLHSVCVSSQRTDTSIHGHHWACR